MSAVLSVEVTNGTEMNQRSSRSDDGGRPLAYSDVCLILETLALCCMLKMPQKVQLISVSIILIKAPVLGCPSTFNKYSIYYRVTPRKLSPPSPRSAIREEIAVLAGGWVRALPAVDNHRPSTLRGKSVFFYIQHELQKGLGTVWSFVIRP